jgi:hypothetical protein
MNGDMTSVSYTPLWRGVCALDSFWSQVEVFWFMTLCNDVVGYRRFGGSYCLHLQGMKWTVWMTAFDLSWVNVKLGVMCDPPQPGHRCHTNDMFFYEVTSWKASQSTETNWKVYSSWVHIMLRFFIPHWLWCSSAADINLISLQIIHH